MNSQMGNNENHSIAKQETKSLNVELPIAVYRYATGHAKLNGMKIKDFVKNALLEYGHKLSDANTDEIIELKR